jgi:plastocyanin
MAMRLRRTLISVLAILALMLAACGGDDSSTTTDSAATAEATATAEETPAATEDSGGGEAESGDAVTITMKGFAFSPAEQTVKVGQAVTWKNEDSAPHNAVSDDGVLKTDDVNQGETTEPFTPEKAGTIEYICTIHPQMKATLTVTE